MAKHNKVFLEGIEKFRKKNKKLQQRLLEAKESVNAIKTGNIDALVIADKKNLKVYTEETADKTYRILIEKMHEGAVTINEDGIILYSNIYFSNLLDLPLQKVIGSKFKEFIDDSSKERFEAILKRGRKHAAKGEGYIYSSKGRVIPVLMSVNTFSLNNNLVLSIILTDLTIQNENQEELRHRTKQLEQKNLELESANKELAFQSEEKEKRAEETKKDEEYISQLAAIVESSADAIISKSLDGTIISWNKGSEVIFGYTAKQAIGKNIDMIIPPEYSTEESGIIKRIRNNEIVHYETIRNKKSGEKIPVSITVSPVKDLAGNIIGASKIARDITFSKISERELIQANKELENANKDLTSFTYVSSHDLQEPLRKIRNFITVLLEDEKKNLSVEGKKYLERTYQTAERMQALIEDLLTYSRTMNPERNFEKTDLTVIVDEVKKDLEEVILQKKATIEATHLCEARILRIQFHQLLQNLISNSLKFSKPQTPPQIIITSETLRGSKLKNDKLSSASDYCHITYTDNGIGFDPQYNERILEVFQRLHSNDEYPGTGMGLAICKRIVENHHGIMTTTGELNKGARFDIYIPVS